MARLPNLADYLATRIEGTSLSIGNHSLGGRHDGDSQTIEDLRDLSNLGVAPQPGLADPLQTGNNRLLIGPVFQFDLQHLALVFTGSLLKIIDIPFLLKNLGDIDFDVRKAGIDCIVETKTLLSAEPLR